MLFCGARFVCISKEMRKNRLVSLFRRSFFFETHFFLGHFRIKFLLQYFLVTQYKALKLDGNKSPERI